MKIFSGKWSEQFDKEKGTFDLKKDVLESNKLPLLPGRFYILNYMSKSDKPTNTRPIIISLGLSKKDPESFLCIDLCVIPKPIRIKFVEMYFQLFSREIEPNIQKYWELEDADKQSEIKRATYTNILSVKDFNIIKLAIKRYKIKKTVKIYSLLFCDVYKVIGDFADENMFVNGTIKDVQADFFEQSKKIK